MTKIVEKDGFEFYVPFNLFDYFLYFLIRILFGKRGSRQ